MATRLGQPLDICILSQPNSRSFFIGFDYDPRIRDMVGFDIAFDQPQVHTSRIIDRCFESNLFITIYDYDPKMSLLLYK